jgi:murein DD-endopeptidase MepM/ murein hydrolase activator NlpD
VAKDTVPVSAEVFESSGTLTSSLWAAMSSAGLSPAVIMEFADIFAWEIDFLTEPRAGDRFALVWEERVNALGRRCGIRLSAAAYSGSEAGDARGYWYEGSYYNDKGDSLRRAFLRAPLSYRRISSYFSKARFHPILRRYRAHNGIDYAAPPGTPVSAVADGVVSFKGWKGGYGNFIELRHGGSYVTGYGHLRGFARGLRQGQKVSQGQVIGYVGSTGLSTGPHLDFSLKVNGRFTDFLRFRPPSVASLSGAELKRFGETSAPLAVRLDGLLPANSSGNK